MLKEAMQYIVGLAKPELFHIGERTFSSSSLQVISNPRSETIGVRSLSGLVDYIRSGFDATGKLMVHVVSPTKVIAFNTLDQEADRNKYIAAEAMLPEFRFGSFHGVEEFIISLQAGFVDANDRATVLGIVGNIKEESVSQYGDDGVSQAVTAKQGITTVATVKVPNPVVLAPFRTFVEVEQPASEFVFRMQNGPKAALFEADGGAWKISAMQNIKAYLTKSLQEQITAREVVIIA